MRFERRATENDILLMPIPKKSVASFEVADDRGAESKRNFQIKTRRYAPLSQLIPYVFLDTRKNKHSQNDIGLKQSREFSYN